MTSKSTITRIAISAILIMSVCIDVKAQWDPQFSDYTALKAYYNPATAGVNGLLNVHAAYSMQMAGFDDAPKTVFFGADCPVYFLGPNHGAGLSLMNDQVGIFSTQKIAVQYAANIKLGKGRLAIGVQPGIISETIDPTNLELEDSSDPAFPSAQTSGTAFDLGAGLYFEHPKFWAGIAAQHVLSPQITLGQTKFINIDPTFNLMGGCNIKLKNPFLSLQPSFMVLTDMTSWREDITCRLTYSYEEKKFWGGVGYSPQTSFTAFIGGTFHGISLGYSYQMYTTGVDLQNGSHELVLGYQTNLDLFKKGRNKHKSVRIL